VYGSSLQQVKEMYAIDPNMAGELAISILEVALTGTMSTDNPLIKMALANFKDVAGKNQIKYDKKVEVKRAARIEKLQLREIAEMYKQGVPQNIIAKKLGKGASTVSENLKTIRTEFPELLADYSENSTNSDELGEFDNDSEILPNSENSGEFDELELSSLNSENSENSEYVNDNDNVNDNVNVSPSPDGEELPSVSLSELNRLGVSFIWLDGETIQDKDTGKILHVEV
jgi:hypothetical protein